MKVSLLAKETAIARVERERDLLKERLAACEGSNSSELHLIADDAREHRSELQRLKGLLERTRFSLDQKRSDLGLLLGQIQDAELKIEELRTQVPLSTLLSFLVPLTRFFARCLVIRWHILLAERCSSIFGSITNIPAILIHKISLR